MKLFDNVIVGTLFSGYDYKHQAWVKEGVYLDCNHPQPGTLLASGNPFLGCVCYGRAHTGERFQI